MPLGEAGEEEEALSVRTVQVTEVSCDGESGQGCPDSTVLVFGAPVRVVMSRMAAEGWSTDGEINCPSCAAAADSGSGKAGSTVLSLVRQPGLRSITLSDAGRKAC